MLTSQRDFVYPASCLLERQMDSLLRPGPLSAGLEPVALILKVSYPGLFLEVYLSAAGNL